MLELMALVNVIASQLCVVANDIGQCDGVSADRSVVTGSLLGVEGVG